MSVHVKMLVLAVVAGVVMLLLAGCIEVEERAEMDEAAYQQLCARVKQDIDVAIEFQGFDECEKQKVVIWVENNSNDAFRGDLKVTVRDGETIRGVNTYHIEVEPGLRTYAVMRLRANTGSGGGGTYRWSNVSFSEASEYAEEIIPME